MVAATGNGDDVLIPELAVTQHSSNGCDVYFDFPLVYEGIWPDVRDHLFLAAVPTRNSVHLVTERVIGSIRRECVDHVIVMNAAGLHRVLTDYVAHYEDVVGD